MPARTQKENRYAAAFASGQRVGNEGQLSIPEQNEIVAEAAGPSPHLLPASSKTASGTSKLSVSSS